jgi:hypothetical protein
MTHTYTVTTPGERKVIYPKDVYGEYSNAAILEATAIYHIRDFRPPTKGEIYLGTDLAVQEKIYNGGSYQPRLILTPRKLDSIDISPYYEQDKDKVETRTLKPSDVYYTADAQTNIKYLVVKQHCLINGFRPPKKGETFIAAPTGDELIVLSAHDYDDKNPRFIVEYTKVDDIELPEWE